MMYIINHSHRCRFSDDVINTKSSMQEKYHPYYSNYLYFLVDFTASPDYDVQNDTYTMDDFELHSSYSDALCACSCWSKFQDI